MTGNDGFRRRPSLIAKVFMSQRPQHIDRVDVVQALSDEATQLFGGGPPAFRRRREGKHARGHMRAPLPQQAMATLPAATCSSVAVSVTRKPQLQYL